MAEQPNITPAAAPVDEFRAQLSKQDAATYDADLAAFNVKKIAPKATTGDAEQQQQNTSEGTSGLSQNEIEACRGDIQNSKTMTPEQKLEALKQLAGGDETGEIDAAFPNAKAVEYTLPPTLEGPDAAASKEWAGVIRSSFEAVGIDKMSGNAIARDFDQAFRLVGKMSPSEKAAHILGEEQKLHAILGDKYESKLKLAGAMIAQLPAEQRTRINEYILHVGASAKAYMALIGVAERKAMRKV